MKVYQLDVVCKSYEKNDGYNLLFNDAYTLGVSVEAAIKNGYEEIRIRKADTLESLEYIKRLQEQHPEIEIP